MGLNRESSSGAAGTARREDPRHQGQGRLGRALLAEHPLVTSEAG
jgi:hypothetical protein